MAQAGTVPLPRGTHPAPQGFTLGGQNGLIAMPSRASADAGAGYHEEPGRNLPRGGQHGAVDRTRAIMRGIVAWSYLRAPAKPMPVAYSRTFYDRKYHPNVVPIQMMAQPRAPFSWTANTQDNPPTVTSAVPMSARLRVLSWYTQYNNRVQVPYQPPEQFQQAIHTRKPLVGAGYVMGGPYHGRLTSWLAAQSFGAQTPMLGGSGG